MKEQTTTYHDFTSSTSGSAAGLAGRDGMGVASDAFRRTMMSDYRVISVVVVLNEDATRDKSQIRKLNVTLTLPTLFPYAVHDCPS
jgi:hypothetical protein